MTKRLAISSRTSESRGVNYRDPIATASMIADLIGPLNDGISFQTKVRDVAQCVCLSAKEIVDFFRFNNLPPKIQDLAVDGILTVEGASQIEPLLRDRTLVVPDDAPDIIAQMILERRQRFPGVFLPRGEISALISDIRLRFSVSSVVPASRKPPLLLQELPPHLLPIPLFEVIQDGDREGDVKGDETEIIEFAIEDDGAGGPTEEDLITIIRRGEY